MPDRHLHDRSRVTHAEMTAACLDAARIGDAAQPGTDVAARRREQRLQRLIDRLPRNLRAVVRWLRRPAARRVRMPGGLLLIVGSVLSPLPLFGLWMLPLGLVLLAEDVPLLRRARDRSLDWIERHRPHWFADDTESRSRAQLPHSSPKSGTAPSAGPRR